MKYCFVSVFMFYPLFGICQVISTTRIIDSVFTKRQIDSLSFQFNQHDFVPDNIKTTFLLALSYYPELARTSITFKEAKIKTTLNARPTVGSLLFKNRTSRRYVIRINSRLKSDVAKFESVPFNAKIGLLGHELAHFIDYSERNFFGMMGRLLAYSSVKGKEKYEKEIDAVTIARGLGWQLFDWSNFVLNESDSNEGYKEYKRRFYLEPQEIRDIIEEEK